MLREIRQRVTFSASQKARDDEEVEAGPSTSQTRAEPVRLRPAPRKRPTDDLDRLLDTVNDKLQRFAREAAVESAGRGRRDPLRVLDEPPSGSWGSGPP